MNSYGYQFDACTQLIIQIIGFEKMVRNESRLAISIYDGQTLINAKKNYQLGMTLAF